MKFVDIKNDIAFRKIFGNENRKEVVISFLNAVLLLQNDQKIMLVEILTPYHLPAVKGGKIPNVNVKAKDQSGKIYLVEIQVAEVDDFEKRVLYCAAKNFTSQSEREDLFEKLLPTVFVGILSFEITQRRDSLSRHKILDVRTGENLFSDIEFNFIELPKFHNEENELQNLTDQWIYFLKNAEILDAVPESLNDLGLQIAYEDASRHNWSPAELEAYERVQLRDQDVKGRWGGATKKELRKALSHEKEMSARNFLSAGIRAEIVALNTGLSLDEVRKIQSEN
jgi:predicted transposase/invertase (TIGR01784 family)